MNITIEKKINHIDKVVLGLLIVSVRATAGWLYEVEQVVI